MSQHARTIALRLRSIAKKPLNAVVCWLAVALLRTVRHVELERLTDFAARFMRRVGPWLPEHRTGRANLVAAFPDKPAAEIEGECHPRSRSGASARSAAAERA